MRLKCCLAVLDMRPGGGTVVYGTGEVKWWVRENTTAIVVQNGEGRYAAKSVDDFSAKQMRERYCHSSIRTEGIREQMWVLVDYGDVVVKVFAEETCRFYEIERLYKDVPKVEWQEPSRYDLVSH